MQQPSMHLAQCFHSLQMRAEALTIMNRFPPTPLPPYIQKSILLPARVSKHEAMRNCCLCTQLCALPLTNGHMSDE